MATFYCVTTTVYDNGRTSMHIIPQQAETKPQNSMRSTNRADYYCDWFDTLEQANSFMRDNS